MTATGTESAWERRQEPSMPDGRGPVLPGQQKLPGSTFLSLWPEYHQQDGDMVCEEATSWGDGTSVHGWQHCPVSLEG